MNALQTPTTPEIRKLRKRPKPSRSSHPYLGMVTEVSVKLTVNSLILVTAIASLVKLLPHNFSQQAKLREVHSEVSKTEQRVDSLRANFVRSFAPEQSKHVMQEQSSLVDPKQIQVVLSPQPVKD